MKSNGSLKIITLSLIASVMFIGCGESTSSDSTPPVTSTGTFIDAPVQGLSYKTATQSGFTDASGHFKYVAGEDVEFKLGTLSLGKGTAGALLTPYTISDNNDTATNIALLLQNFDGNRSNAGVLDLSKLQDYDFADVNLSVAPSAMEVEIPNLISAISSNPAFGASFLDTNTTLIDAVAVKTAMDTYIDDNSMKYDKKFTQLFLDNNDFYMSSTDNGAYRNKYRNGDIYFAGDEIGDAAWDSNFTTPSSTYTLVDGKINAMFSTGENVIFEIKEITNKYVKVIGKLVGAETSIESTWYMSKEAAVTNTSTLEYGFGTEWLKANKLYLANGMYMDFVGGKCVVHNTDGTQAKAYTSGDVITKVDYNQPYSVENGILKVDEIGIPAWDAPNALKDANSTDRYQLYKVKSVGTNQITLYQGQAGNTAAGVGTFDFITANDLQTFYLTKP